LILSSSDSPKQILARRVSLLQKKDLQKRERERREGARIKSKKNHHPPRQGHEKLNEKEEDENYKRSGRDLLKRKVKMEITFSRGAKSDMWPHSHPHIICICTIL
jgi:hypothetical protein